jgi:hypothetical protein
MVARSGILNYELANWLGNQLIGGRNQRVIWDLPLVDKSWLLTKPQPRFNREHDSRQYLP